MTEDGKIFDYELDWIPVSSGSDKRILFMNKDRGSLFRIIDMENETYSFSDVERIERIRDINKVLIKEDDEELNKRREAWTPREPKVTTGYLARYASMVTSGNRGAILEIPKN